MALEYGASDWLVLIVTVGIILFGTVIYAMLRWGENSRKSVSGWWWLLPIFLNILGGIMMFIALRRENYDIAKKGLIMGFIITVLEIALYLMIILTGALAILRL